MDSSERAAVKPGDSGSRSLLFTVRLWRQEGPAGSAYRGNVREVISGANRSFRDWVEMAQFMADRMEEGESRPGERGDTAG